MKCVEFLLHLQIIPGEVPESVCDISESSDKGTMEDNSQWVMFEFGAIFLSKFSRN